MAEDSKELTQEERDRIIQWIVEKSGDNTEMPCPVCKSNDWYVPEHLVIAPIVSPQGEVAIGGLGYPHSPIICQKCGFTYFINAARMGISRQHQDDESAVKSAEEQGVESKKQEENDG